MKISNIKKISGRVLSYIVSRESIITLITCVAVSIIIGACMVYSRKDEDKSIKVGIIYVGDAKDFQQKGTVSTYKANNTQSAVNTLTTGIAPSFFYFIK